MGSVLGQGAINHDRDVAHVVGLLGQREPLLVPTAQDPAQTGKVVGDLGGGEKEDGGGGVRITARAQADVQGLACGAEVLGGVHLSSYRRRSGHVLCSRLHVFWTSGGIGI